MFNVITQVLWRASDYPITIAELRSASKELSRLLTDEERDELSEFLAFNPECGDIIPSTGGVRKMRWSCGSKGKRSGLRILYYFHDLNMPLYILAVYAKGETIRLTIREERLMTRLVGELVREYAGRNRLSAKLA